NDLSSNRKSKPSTVALQFLRPVEFVEDLGLLGFGEAGTMVYHTESNKLPVPTTRSNDHIGVRKAIFQCVRDEIGKDQTYAVWIRRNVRKIRRHVRVQLQFCRRA